MLEKNDTPNATCYKFLRHSRFSITSILFFPKNRDFMLETFSKFSIFFILFEPSYNIYKTGKSRFCIFV